MTKKEKQNIILFVKDYLHDAVMYFTGEPLPKKHEREFNLNFEKKFEEYLEEYLNEKRD